MDLEAVDPVTEAHVPDLVRLYRQAWWAEDRRAEDVEAMLRHTDVTIGYADPRAGRLVAFARAITDRVYKALVLDVIVDTDHRGHGLGAGLMDRLVHHPHLRGVAHFELYCRPDLRAFYERWGFREGLDGAVVMRRSALTPR